MEIFVTAKTNVRREFVKQIDEKNFHVGVKAIPEKGRANERIIFLLGKFFDIAPSRIFLRSGGASKRKMFDVL